MGLYGIGSDFQGEPAPFALAAVAVVARIRTGSIVIPVMLCVLGRLVEFLLGLPDYARWHEHIFH